MTTRELTLLSDGKLHVYILDIGQGDSALIITPIGKQMLIDGGPDLSTLEHLGKYMPFFDRSIDLIVLTHPHADHLTALPEVLKRYKVNNILMAMSESKNARYRSFLNEASKQNIPIIVSNPENDFILEDEIRIDVIWPHISQKTLNNSSVVLKLLYKEHSILLTGDIEEEAEHAILRNGADVSANILKVAHHGSRTSSSTQFLKKVDPELALISVGEGNRYGHPSPEIIKKLKNMNIKVRTTESGGTLHLELK